MNLNRRTMLGLLAASPVISAVKPQPASAAPGEKRPLRYVGVDHALGPDQTAVVVLDANGCISGFHVRADMFEVRADMFEIRDPNAPRRH